MHSDNKNMIPQVAIETAISFDHIPQEYEKYLRYMQNNEPEVFAYIFQSANESIELISENIPEAFSDYPLLVTFINQCLVKHAFKGMVLGESKWKPQLDFIVTGEYKIKNNDFI